MTADVYWKLHDALSPIGQCFLELLYLTRQRPTEIRLLRESQVGPERIHFRPTKTEESSGEEVDVLITPEIRAAIDRARERRPKRKVEDLARHRDPYIIQARDGDKYTKNGLYEVWRDACQAAGVKGVTTRHVRPFALSEMERLGYDVREIQKAAAHASITTTEGYLDQHRDRLSDARLPLPPRKT
jgi:integrase